jgi:hypothetical protein
MAFCKTTSTKAITNDQIDYLQQSKHLIEKESDKIKNTPVFIISTLKLYHKCDHM